MTQESQKNNTVLIVIAIIGVVGTIVASAIGAIGNYSAEKLRQETELTRIALGSVTTQSGTTQISTATQAPTSVILPTNIISSSIVLANNATGTSTGLHVKQGDVLTFSASGRWCWGGTTDCSSPDGTLGRPSGIEECCAVIQDEFFGKLIGRIGDWVFPIGSQATVTIKQEGDLFLLMNDRIGAHTDNTGSIKVEIETKSH